MSESHDSGPVESTPDSRDLSPSAPWSPQTKIAVAVGLVVLAAFVLWLAKGALSILAVAGIVAFLVAPMVRTLHRRFRWPRWLALGTGYVVVLVFSLLILAVLAVGITKSLAGIDLGEMQDTARNVGQWFVDWADGLVVFGINVDLSDVTRPIHDWLNNAPTDGSVGGIKIDMDTVQALLGGAFNSIRTVTGFITAMVMSALITMMIAIYLNADSQNLYRWIQRVVPPGYEGDAAVLSDETGAIWRGYIYGQLINSIITGLMVFIVLAVVGCRGRS